MHRVYVPDTVTNLLDAIYANLDDDGPRLVYADELQEAGDPRGELIAVQCELARLGYAVKQAHWDWIGDALADDDVDPAHIAKLRRREKQLLDEHADRWLADAKKLNPLSLRFERGFVTHIETGASAGMGTKLTALREVFPTLDSLDIPSLNGLDIAQIFAWPGFAELRNLRMPVSGVQGLVRLAKAKLRDLSLRCTDRNDYHLVPQLFEWAPFKGLTALEVSSAALTADHATQLAASCGPLRELQLRSAKIGPGGAAALGGAKSLAQLEILSVISNGIGGKGVASLMKLGKLHAIDLRKNKVGVEGAEALAGHKALRTIDLTGNTVSAEMIEAMCSGKGLGALRELCLQATHVDDEALAVLCASPLLGRLTSLNLRSNKITDKGAKLLAKSKHASKLRALNLNNNDITAVGKKALDDSKHLAKARISLLVPKARK